MWTPGICAAIAFGKMLPVAGAPRILWRERTRSEFDPGIAALNLPAWEPTRHGKSGDWRMEELFKLPVEERAEALYGMPAPA